MQKLSHTTPIGNISITAEGSHITHVDIGHKTKRENATVPKLVKSCCSQLDAYFVGRQKAFSLPLQISGTAFQKAVWKAIAAIPYGQTRTYGEIAKKIGKPGAVRAVGQACGANPLLILIPCHRVLGTSSLGGYAAGLQRKKWLLRHEDVVLP